MEGHDTALDLNRQWATKQRDILPVRHQMLGDAKDTHFRAAETGISLSRNFPKKVSHHRVAEATKASLRTDTIHPWFFPHFSLAGQQQTPQNVWKELARLKLRFSETLFGGTFCLTFENFNFNQTKLHCVRRKLNQRVFGANSIAPLFCAEVCNTILKSFLVPSLSSGDNPESSIGFTPKQYHHHPCVTDGSCIVFVTEYGNRR